MDLDCKICQLSKHICNSYPLSVNKSLHPFVIIHSDVWGPSTSSLFGYRYFVTFVDDHSSCMLVYLMKAKDGDGSIFQSFHKMIRIQFRASIIKVLYFDNGGSIFQPPCRLILPLLELNTKLHV